MAYVQAQGARIHYEVSGPADGEPVTLVMGLGWDMSAWDALVPQLHAAGFRVLRIDNRGVGVSDAPDIPYSIPGMAGDVVAAMVAAGIGSSHVYGASMGSMIAQELALSRPERVRSLVLGCPSPGVVSVPGAPGILRLLLTPHGYSAEERYRRAAPYLFGDSLEKNPGAVEATLKQRLGRSISPVGYRRQLQAILRWSSLTRLRGLRKPTLVMHGDRDRLVPIANGRLIARLIPGARMLVLRGAGHVYSADHPEVSSRAAIEFFSEQRLAATA
ncbi:MAG: alpha/beta fold hydrolase [Candidatus Dormibacteria bacterium]